MGHELPHLEIMLTLKCMVPVLLAMKEKKKVDHLKEGHFCLGFVEFL